MWSINNDNDKEKWRENVCINDIINETIEELVKCEYILI